MGLGIFSQIRIATERTIFAMPEAKIGHFCDVGSAYFLPKIVPHPSHALFLALTGKYLRGN